MPLSTVLFDLGFFSIDNRSNDTVAQHVHGAATAHGSQGYVSQAAEPDGWTRVDAPAWKCRMEALDHDTAAERQLYHTNEAKLPAPRYLSN